MAGAGGAACGAPSVRGARPLLGEKRFPHQQGRSHTSRIRLATVSVLYCTSLQTPQVCLQPLLHMDLEHCCVPLHVHSLSAHCFANATHVRPNALPPSTELRRFAWSWGGCTTMRLADCWAHAFVLAAGVESQVSIDASHHSPLCARAQHRTFFLNRSWPVRLRLRGALYHTDPRLVACSRSR